MYSHILLPTDGSAAAEDALDHALDLARSYGATLHVLAVVDPLDAQPDSRAEEVLGQLESIARETVDELVDGIETAGVTAVTGTVEHGTPYRVICEYAADHDVDLIVMSTHGRTGLERYLLGSVTEKVVRTADAPVLTVRKSDPGT